MKTLSEIEYCAGYINLGEGEMTSRKYIRRAIQEAYQLGLTKAAALCKEMAVRYDADIEGCSGEALLWYEGSIVCCNRLAKIIETDTIDRWIDGESVSS